MVHDHHRSSCAPVSVLVLTKDEQVNIADCLRSLDFSDDVVVLDSYSTDRTVAIAESFPNVRVVQRRFDTWSQHSNWALDHIDFKHPWVYYSDADEVVPIPLRDEIISQITQPDQPHVAFRLRYRNIFRDRWLRHGGIYPVWILRLFRPDKVRYEPREVNAHPVVDGSTGELREHFVHRSFNKGLVPWFGKHNGYSEMEAHEAMRVKRLPWRQLLGDLVSTDRTERRRAMKNLSFRLPGRAFLRFAYMYLARLGLLDGGAGFHYAAMISMYEYWIALKIREQQRDWPRQTGEFADRMLQDPHVTVREASTAIDVIIPTFNEAHHIAEAIAGARTIGTVHVLDSGSTDGTQRVARDAGAIVLEHPFEGYARQKNWGLDHLPLKGDWVFILDADERITSQLRDELLDLAEADPPVDGCFVNRRMLFMGRPIMHGGLYPSWNLRFFRRGKARYEQRSVHEHMICDGPIRYLRHPMLHVRQESITQYITKHIRYADLESDEWIKRKLGRSEVASSDRLFRHMLRHRQWLRRRIWPHLPFRPLWRFIYMYFVRLGFLDGRAGWDLACLMASYEYMIGLLYDEKKARLRVDTQGANTAVTLAEKGPARSAAS